MTPRQIVSCQEYVVARQRRRLADMLRVVAVANSGDSKSVNKELDRLSRE